MENRRISRKQLEAARREVGGRGMEVLSSIRKYKYITTGQLRRLHFTGGSERAALRSANRTLARLRDSGLIFSLARRIGGERAGSGSFVWSITAAGARLLAMTDGDVSGRKRNFEPSVAFLTHTLAVAETAVRLTEWAGAGKPSLITLQTEPDSWRQYAGTGGVARYLKPDLFTVTSSGEYEDYYFLELDMATESPAAVLRKCSQYTAYRNTGNAQREYGVFPLVVWLVPDEKRKISLTRHIGNTGIFKVITMDELEPLILGGAGE